MLWWCGDVNLGFQKRGNAQRDRGGEFPYILAGWENPHYLLPNRVVVQILKWIFTGKVAVLNFKRVYRVLGREGFSH